MQSLKSIICYIDINECLTENGGCSHLCYNNIGSFSCSCHEGYNLMDKLFCQGNIVIIMTYTNIIAILLCAVNDEHLFII